MMVIMHKCNVQTAVHTAELEWSVTVSEWLGVAVQQQIFRLLVAARAEATTATAETIRFFFCFQHQSSCTSNSGLGSSPCSQSR